MSNRDPRTGSPRDVPPPRPVQPSAASSTGATAAGSSASDGLARAARALADTVASLLGPADDGVGSAARTGGAAAAGVLRDVVAAVASAARGARDPGGDRARQPAAGERPGRDLSPTALLGDLLAAAGPWLPIRNAARLRQAYPGRSEEEIADALVSRAARLTSTIGAATGGLSAAQWLAPPSLLALPLELGAETVLVAAVELVLVGELHELYGRPAPGDPGARTAAYLGSWSRQRAVDGTTTNLAGVLSSAGLRTLRLRMGRRLVRALPSAAPLLLGAAVAGRGNCKATETLAERLRRDLRRSPAPDRQQGPHQDPHRPPDPGPGGERG